MKKEINQSDLEKKLKICEARNRLFLQCINGIAYQINLTSQINLQKPELIFMGGGGIEEITGYSSEDFKNGNKCWKDLVFHEDLELFSNEVKKLLTIENYFANTEYRIVHRNGKIKWIRDIAKKLKVSPDCSILHGILYDITEQKENEELLKLTQHSIDNARNPVFWIGSEGEILYVNKSACKILEYDEEELLKMTVFDIDPNLKRENWKEHWKHTLEKKSYIFETLHKTKSGRIFPVEISVDTIKYKGQEIHTDFVRDISDRKKFEAELIKAKEKAEISDKMKTAFLTQMSHEIRTPLQKILGFVSLIKDYIEYSLQNIEPEINEYFIMINLSSKRLIRTIDAILNMSEIQTNSYKPIFGERDLYLILFNLYQEFKPEASIKKLDFDFIALTNDTSLWIDEYSIIKIFENLIDNAIKYTDSGSVKLIMRRDELNRLYVEVADTGIGMSKEFMEKLFVPFSQEEIGYTRTYEGIGLGLALVKKYCDLNNALIEVHSEKGKGTTIRITFLFSSKDNYVANDSFQNIEQDS